MYLLELFGSPACPQKRVDVVKLNGPFIDESYLIRHREESFVLTTNALSKCNLIVSRDLMILSQDDTLITRDNQRMEIGIDHHIHNFEIVFKNNEEYQVLAIDHYALLNPLDEKIMKDFLFKYLPASKELKNTNRI